MKIAVVGAGTMGIGVSQVFASKNYTVLMCSSSIASAERGKEKLKKSLAKRVARGKMSQEAMEDLLSNVHVGELGDCVDCDMILECIPENMEMKRELFSKLQSICKDSCIFASNTSSLSITEIAAGIKQPVIGTHFFNPAPVMKLVEIIPGLNTPQEVLVKVMELIKELGKVPVEVKENAGFAVNRILIPMINEAIGLYAEGIASVEDLDNAMKLGANHPMGPLELGDFIGLDVCLAIMEVLYDETGDSKYRPHPMLRKMVRGGWLGVKAGRGFYRYAGE